MKGAMKMEVFHGKDNPLGKFTQSYYDKVMSPELTQDLVAIFGKDSKYLLREFLFGIDCLVDLINDPETPMKRLLNNQDVDQVLVFKLQHRARLEMKPELYGCQVGSVITDTIDEFYDRKYLRLFNYVLSKTRPHLTVPVDGKEYLLSINREFSSTTGHAVLYFKDTSMHDRRISLPFNKSRLAD